LPIWVNGCTFTWNERKNPRNFSLRIASILGLHSEIGTFRMSVCNTAITPSCSAALEVLLLRNATYVGCYQLHAAESWQKSRQYVLTGQEISSNFSENKVCYRNKNHLLLERAMIQHGWSRSETHTVLNN
jgi:hypothetical protein